MILLNAIAASDSQWCEHSLTHSLIHSTTSFTVLSLFVSGNCHCTLCQLHKQLSCFVDETLSACLPASTRQSEEKREATTF